MNDRIQLNTEQRNYLIRLKSAMNTKYSELSLIEDSTEFLGATHLKDSIKFFRKIVSNGYYNKTSSEKITRIAERYNQLLDNSEIKS